MQAWENEAVDRSISTSELDQALLEFKEARTAKDEVNKEVSRLDAALKEKQQILENLLEASGKKFWELEGVGRATRASRLQVTCPKDLDNKAKMLKFLKDISPETYLSLVSIHSATLNAFYKEQAEQDPNFTMPGIDAPTHRDYIIWRKK